MRYRDTVGEQNENSPPYERGASETASLHLFHEGQEAALKSDIEAAVKKLEQSLSAAHPSSEQEWVAYVEGTLAYLRGNRTALEAYIGRAGNNAQILMKLAQGLNKRGSVNYAEDYLG